MAEKQNMTVPEYYPKFQCKCGSCRSCCCAGWGVSISRDDYFRLESVQCSASLRRRLDRAFFLLPDATPERYAALSHDWSGRCWLQREDGFCALQRTCGEAALPAVCRLYPRRYRRDFRRECSCANSCERTLELLLELQAPLRFITVELPPSWPDSPLEVFDEQCRKNYEVRLRILTLLQDRRFSLTERLSNLLHLAKLFPSDEDDPAASLRLCVLLLKRLAVNSRSLSDYLGAASQLYGIAFDEGPLNVPPETLGSAARAFREHERQFKERFPQWPVFAEHMMVNHACFDSLELVNSAESLRDRLISYRAAYTLLQFLAVAWTQTHKSTEALVDVCAAVFRFVEHSGFRRNAPIVLRRAG